MPERPLPNPIFFILTLIVITIVVYLNSFQGVFLFDDFDNIVDNPKIHSLNWPWTFLENTRRPFLFFTLALNYALSGQSIVSYHFVNLSLHLLAGLLLFEIIRRVGCSQKISFSAGLAFTVSSIWLLHPLQTESVTYIIQRAEVLAGMCYFLTFYACLRYWEKSALVWLVTAILASVFGILSKETAVTIPIFILLYDRAFVCGSFRAALNRHRWLYTGLALSWIIMLWLFFSVERLLRPVQLSADPGPTWLQYLMTQPAVIWQYLKLTIWPHPLIFDYLWPFANTFKEAFIPSLLLGLVFAAGVWAYLRKKMIGFLTLNFFLILFPSSGAIALQDAYFEHRMYIPLACVILVAVLAIHRVLAENFTSRLVQIWVVMIILGLGAMTISRNKNYASEIGMWEDVLKKRPENSRACNILGNAYVAAGRKEEAKIIYERAIVLNPRYATVYTNLANILYDLKMPQEAMTTYQKALVLNPEDVSAWNNLGDTFRSLGKFKEAREAFQQAIRIKPNFAPAHFNLHQIDLDEKKAKD